jgi:hypothetical protein
MKPGRAQKLKEYAFTNYFKKVNQMLEDPQATDKPERMFNRNIKLSD